MAFAHVHVQNMRFDEGTCNAICACACAEHAHAKMRMCMAHVLHLAHAHHVPNL